MVLVMHPEGMSLVKANLAGILTPGIKLSYWSTSSIERLIATNLGIDSDTSDNVYIGAYSTNIYHKFIWIFKINPNEVNISSQLRTYH